VKASLFYLPTVANRREIEAGLASMRPELYQRMLRDISEQVQLADDLGYHSVSFTEHHFHLEGFEVPISRFCSIFTYPHARKAAPPAADRLGVLLHL
jgi:alkanesulfonate monooxygenase SsuD/methylene tetrahydromethanopterin reductase-like flavin-dependent oxidoreductase (luciferase family)